MEVKVMYPTVEQLLAVHLGKNLPCTIPNCYKTFAQSSALNLHQVKVHHIVQNEQSMLLFKGNSVAKIAYRYHCPVTGCKYHEDVGVFFKTFVATRKHYLNLHAPKTFKCERCEQSYRLEEQLKRHSSTCNTTFMCSTCMQSFTCKRDLYEHCVESGHRYCFSEVPSAAQDRNDTTVVNQIADKESKTLNQEPTERSEFNMKSDALLTNSKLPSTDLSQVSRVTPSNSVSGRLIGKELECREPNNINTLAPTIAMKLQPSGYTVERPHDSNSPHEVDNSNTRSPRASKHVLVPFDSADIVKFTKLNTEKSRKTLFSDTKNSNSSLMEDSTSPALSVENTASRKSANITDIVELKSGKPTVSLSIDMKASYPSPVVENITTTTLKETPSEFSMPWPNLTRSVNLKERQFDNEQSTTTDDLDCNPSKDKVSQCKTNSEYVSTNQHVSNLNNGLFKPFKDVITENHAKYKGILPKPACNTYIIIPPTFQGNLIMNTTNYNIHAKSASNQIRTYKTICPNEVKHSQLSNKLNTIHRSSFNYPQISTSQTDNLEITIPAEDSLSNFLSPADKQTGHTEFRAAETQTLGDNILTQAMKSAQLPVTRQSKGSQVSPRAKLKRSARAADLHTSETQTQSLQAGKSAKRRRRGSFIGCDTSVNTDTLPTSGRHLGNQNKPVFHDVAVQKIQTETECVLPLPSVEDVARIVESISTQTAESFLATCSEGPSIENVRDSEMQTHLYMGMGLDSCNTVDIEALKQLGVAYGSNSPFGRSLVTPSSSFDSAYTHTSSAVPSPIGIPEPQLGNLHSVSCATDAPATLDEFLLSDKTWPSMTSVSSTPPPPYEEAISQTSAFKDPMMSPPHYTDDVLSGSLNLLPSAGVLPAISGEPSSSLTAFSSSYSQCDFSLPSLLSTQVQTMDLSDLCSADNQTQTIESQESSDADQLLDEILLSHIETQTTDDIWKELVSISDSHTQTTDLGWLSPEAPQWGSNPLGEGSTVPEGGVTMTSLAEASQQHAEVQASLHPMEISGSHVVSADTETQTPFDMALTDSHTQTRWYDLMKFKGT